VLDTVTRSGKLTERERFAGAIEASLQFSKGGGRTVLTRQRIPYPFHATRPFYLDQRARTLPRSICNPLPAGFIAATVSRFRSPPSRIAPRT
jgi:hypothetical protein